MVTIGILVVLFGTGILLITRNKRKVKELEAEARTLRWEE